MVLAEILPPPQRRNSFSGSDKSPTQNKSYWWSFTSKLLRSDSVSNSNQHIATQKLRESKYFREDEERLFCAVIETGFIVEMKIETTTHDHQNTETKSHQQQHYFGIVSVESKKSKHTRVDLFFYHHEIGANIIIIINAHSLNWLWLVLVINKNYYLHVQITIDYFCPIFFSLRIF